MILMLSSFGLPTTADGSKVYCRKIINGVPKSPNHIMRSIDIANQVRGVYSCEISIHKWWHRLFFFLLDNTVVNIFLMHKIACESFRVIYRDIMTAS